MTYRDDLNLTSDALDQYLDDIQHRKMPVLIQAAMAGLADALDINRLISEGGLHGSRLQAFLAIYLDNATHIQHPASMGHQVASPHPSGVIGGLIDVFTNNPMAIYEMGPSAATVEYAMVNWMLQKTGWTPMPLPGQGHRAEQGSYGAGVLTHGGSLAQLTALLAARSHADKNIWAEGNNPDLVVIAPREAHYSLSRALGILGMGQNALVPADCGPDGLIIPHKLQQTIREVQNSGRTIMAVAANAGCTAAGLYDDLDAIGDICIAHGLWLHVDGAHGASALLSDKYRHRLNGLEKATSLIWDAHKMMRTPGLCAGVLFRDHRHLDQAFTQEASYLFHDKDQAGFDAISRTIECTKAGLGLRFFMVLAAEGEQGIGDYVESRYDLAIETADLITGHARFELAVQPQANIVCFRFKDLSDSQHLELRKKLLASGESYITTTAFNGRRWLRMTFMNPLTAMVDVQHTLDMLLHGASQLADESAQDGKA